MDDNKPIPDRDSLLAEKKKIMANLVLFIAALFVVLFAWGTMAWFASNKENEATGMGVRVQGKDFDLITMSSDATNKNGAYYNPYHQAIQADETEAYDIWLVDSGSSMNNYTSTGMAGSSLGIEPGSSGVIKFYIKPYQTVTIDFDFQTIGYTARTTGGQTTMTELSSAAGNPACFLNGHVLLFEGHDSATTYYSNLIPAGSDGQRTFSREFELNGNYDADTDGDSIYDAYEVDIYWVWAETLDTLVYNSNSAATLLCDRNASGENDNDYTRVVNNICTYPQYYLKGYSSRITYTEALVVGRNAMYNDADQDIGMNIDYVLLRLDAKAASGN